VILPLINPVAISPKGYNIPLSCVLKASSFTDADENDTQTASQWEIYLSYQTEDDTPILHKEITKNLKASIPLNELPITWGTLKPDTEYKWRVRYKDAYGPLWSEWSDFAVFKTVKFDPELHEQIPDETQLKLLKDNVGVETGIKNIINFETIGIKCNYGNISMIKSIDPALLENKPKKLPFGLFSFRIDNIPEGQETVNVTFYVPGNFTGYDWYKYDEIKGWEVYPAIFEYMPNIGYTKIDFILVDGGGDDYDGVKNGSIVDPSGPGLLKEEILEQEIKEVSGGGGCFIATACFGNYNHPFVRILREFRDKILLKNSIGRNFVNWYYAHSPKYAEIIRNNLILKLITQILLIPVVFIAYLIVKGLLPLLLIIFCLFILRKKYVSKLLILLLLLILSKNSFAQDLNLLKIAPGEKYTVVSPTRNIVEKGKFQIDFFYSFTDDLLKGVVGGSKRVIIDSQNLVQIGLTYGLNEKTNISLLIPYLMDQDILSGQKLITDDSGFGDIYLSGKFKVYDGGKECYGVLWSVGNSIYRFE
jgi:hypothetical protein